MKRNELRNLMLAVVTAALLMTLVGCGDAEDAGRIEHHTPAVASEPIDDQSPKKPTPPLTTDDISVAEMLQAMADRAKGPFRSTPGN